ncbi:MAG: tRNA (guanosine(37)-N1)-methyltransferase TrmD [Hydrogenobacter sp.]|uniref:tRNA (guanosine(37)-N1)-methyltransferase TrmD n=1 Tax=Hydrogenobacter thermophilus TaxID=940 RepID=UPI0030F96150
MKFFVFTLFPQVIQGYAQYGVIKQAIKKGSLELHVVNLREYAIKRKVDDEAYGGVPGMVIKPEPVFCAYRSITQNYGKPHTIIPQPWGKRLVQQDFERLSRKESIAIICGRYEGLDERTSVLADEELSLGDFVLSGGEIFALALLEGVARLLPGVLSQPESLLSDSFRRWMGYPVYTRPPEYEGMKVPDVLLSGNHKLIELWRLWHSIERTLKYRPDLIPDDLTPMEKDIVENIKKGTKFEDWVKGR